jgi:hypothetical protein
MALLPFQLIELAGQCVAGVSEGGKIDIVKGCDSLHRLRIPAQ